MSNRIIVPTKYDTEIVILFDNTTGQTELRVKKGRITVMVLAGILSEHITGLLKQMVQAVSNKPQPLIQTGDGGNGNAVT